VTSGR
jgi:hypothetical protein